MFTTPTIDKLHALNLMGMARALTEQQERAEYHSLGFEDRLGMLVDRESQDRENRKLERNLRAAHLRTAAAVEEIDFARSRGLDRSVLLSLAEAGWVTAHRNILVVGPTGAGKTFIACALAQAALRRGHTALYLRAPRLLDDLAIARADGRLARVMAAFARVAVLVVDDLALRPLAAEQAASLLEVVEDRSGLRSTIVTSQLPVAQWHEALGDATIADAILDRLVHNAHRIELRGDSLRRPQEAGAATARTSETARAEADEPASPGPPKKRAATKPAEARA